MIYSIDLIPPVDAITSSDPARNCPFKNYGCNIQVSRQALRDHIISSIDEHLQLFTNSSSTPPTPSDNSDVKIELARQARLIEQLSLEHKSLQSMLLKREQELARACVGVQLCKGELCELKKDIENYKTLLDNDGTYLWRITNISELVRNAKNASQPLYITSPPFYTSKYGYKLSLRLYLHGDKSVREKYLSLYITIMFGEYDSLLKWPFTYPVTLCLYDRSGKRDHVVHTLTPDVTSVCFERPRMVANKSGGIPEFCPLWKVFSKEFGYVRQDEMFIKALIDFNIYPKHIWPQWTSFQSQGLPIHVEHIQLQKLIDKEK